MHGPFREITIQYIDKSVIFVLGMSVSYIVLRSGNSTYPLLQGSTESPSPIAAPPDHVATCCQPTIHPLLFLWPMDNIVHRFSSSFSRPKIVVITYRLPDLDSYRISILSPNISSDIFGLFDRFCVCRFRLNKINFLRFGAL